MSDTGLVYAADVPEPSAQRWAYAGLTEARGGTLAERWITDAGDGQERAYPRRKGTRVLGGIYTALASPVGDRLMLTGTPQYTGERLPPHDRRVQRWAVQDNVVRVRQQQLRAEASDARRDPLDAALAPLVELATQCRTRAERDALIATVLRRMLYPGG